MKKDAVALIKLKKKYANSPEDIMAYDVAISCIQTSIAKDDYEERHPRFYF
ncbi:MAG TPA: hypothetical protein PK891_04070 [Bacteroidales bacterium]|nr:hypothetical protein [Bacteroidales bacterium]